MHKPKTAWVHFFFATFYRNIIYAKNMDLQHDLNAAMASIFVHKEKNSWLIQQQDPQKVDVNKWDFRISGMAGI